MIIQSKSSREIFMWYSIDGKRFTALRTNDSDNSNTAAGWYAAHKNNRYLGPFELIRWES